MNTWSFPPETKEIQLDEKWSFVGKKEKNCGESEKEFGDQWDYIAIDPESRLVLSLVPGKRTLENCYKVVEDVYTRTHGREDILISSDSYSPYKTAIEDVYGEKVIPERKEGPGRPPKKPVNVMPEALCYVTVCKEYEKDKVSSIRREIVFGSEELVTEKLKNSRVSNTINTAFVERVNGTDRLQNSRKVRKTYGFSKDLGFHNALSMLIICMYNFCWCVRTLYLINDGKRVHCTPAMAAKLSEHVWTVEEWVTYPTYHKNELVKNKPFPDGSKRAMKRDLAAVS